MAAIAVIGCAIALPFLKKKPAPAAIPESAVTLAPVVTPPRKTEGSPATATKDEPYANTLGMKFVPVPINGGPTDGQGVLSSIWDTRVQDTKPSPRKRIPNGTPLLSRIPRTRW